MVDEGGSLLCHPTYTAQLSTVSRSINRDGAGSKRDRGNWLEGWVKEHWRDERVPSVIDPSTVEISEVRA